MHALSLATSYIQPKTIPANTAIMIFWQLNHSFRSVTSEVHGDPQFFFFYFARKTSKIYGVFLDPRGPYFLPDSNPFRWPRAARISVSSPKEKNSFEARSTGAESTRSSSRMRFAVLPGSSSTCAFGVSLSVSVPL